jgi:hypothetical protein
MATQAILIQRSNLYLYFISTCNINYCASVGIKSTLKERKHGIFEISSYSVGEISVYFYFQAYHKFH